MTENNETPDDDRSEAEVGDFQFGVPDGGSEEPDDKPPTRTDGAGNTNSRFDFDSWLGDVIPDTGDESTASAAKTTTAAEAEGTVGPADFAGFEFAEWLEETEAKATTTTEAETTTEEAAELGPVYDGFDFGRWITDDSEAGPKEPPDMPRVVGSSPERAVSARSRLLGVLPFFGSPEPVDTYPGGFDFAGWLGEGESDFEPVAATPEPTPDPDPAAAGATVGGEPSYPTPGSGGITDTPPIKVAAFALFAASIVAVAL
ncbi:hypothetical protein GJ631_11120, partial [Natronomonas sp. CBA1123]|nr:hypothetical protein [Natronomonas sp. CBA1123]